MGLSEKQRTLFRAEEIDKQWVANDLSVDCRGGFAECSRLRLCPSSNYLSPSCELLLEIESELPSLVMPDAFDKMRH